MNDTAPSVGVMCLDHVTVIVNDLETSRRFYVDVLGMRQVERPGFSFDGLWFQAGPTQIHLILEHDASGPSGNVVAVELTASRTHHFAFQVADGHAAAKRLTEHGVEIVAGPKDRPDGAVQVFVRDPDGYVVELSSAAG